ncbi:MAG: hypothetical protein A3E79_10255 [Burkholderiales bacterium RIFCSPHIGHO2_12_FULL_61_11]|nr:MAG: hypothetical protein A3E79_10255 [Burkholderiales bacterium RIFCSPHIGHO2_12_FULL_61_11]
MVHHQRYLAVLDGHILAGVVLFHDVARAVYEEPTFENRMLKAYVNDGSTEDEEMSAGRTDEPGHLSFRPARVWPNGISHENASNSTQ